MSYKGSLLPEEKTILTHKLNANTCSVRLYLQLSVGGFMSYLRYLCLFAYSGVQHILCYVFVSFFLRVVYPMLSVSLDCQVNNNNSDRILSIIISKPKKNKENMNY